MGLVQKKMEISIETSPQLIESLHMAREVALNSDVAEVLPAHLVLAMLEDDESSFLLDAYGVDFNKIRTQLGKIVQTQVKPKSLDQHAAFSAGIESIMQHAREQAQKNALAEVDSNLILAVILSEKAGFLGTLLAPYDLDTSGVLQYLELREGKTVNIDPLPSLQPPVNHAEKVAQPTAPRPDPPKKPAPVPNQNPGQQPQPPAPARTGAPAANQQAARAPSPGPQPLPQKPQGQQNAPFTAVAPAKAPPQITPAAQMPAAPHQATPTSPAPTRPPANAGHKAPSPQKPPEQDLSDLSRRLKGLSATSTGATAGASTTQTPATSAPLNEADPTPLNEAPSGLRSLFGGMGKKWHNDARKPGETAASPLPAPPAPAPLTPTPANNNQSQPAAKTKLMPQPEQPPRPPVPQPVSRPAPAPAPMPVATVDQLVAPASPAQTGDTPTAYAPAPMTQHNRPAKRRRAVPSSLGSNESLSATGSVLEKGRLIEAVPRKMKMNKPSRAEVRITREQLDEINSEFEDLSSSHIHDLAVTEAMTVQLRAPGSGFHIENLSPQTQWIDRNQRHINDADFGVWRWNVTPIKSGKSRLQLVISARTVDDDGNIHIADIPDKIIELSIAKDYGKGLGKLAFTAFLVVSSLALGRFGETAWQWISAFVSKLGL